MYLTKYTPKTFFKEYIDFKIFLYLRRFGVISVQSFESHISPQPPGLGLRCITLVNFYREGLFYFLSKIILIFFDDTVPRRRVGFRQRYCVARTCLAGGSDGPATT
jgi:hypothetical protein